MNQILSTNNDNNYNKTDTKKIIVIFCIACILIALVIIAVAIISRNINKGEYVIPQIEIKRQEEKEVTIQVTCEDGINYVLYTWNEEKDNKVNLNGSKSFERIISIPENSSNTLKIEAVSSNGIECIKQEEFELDIDSNKPTIDEMTVSGSTLHIEASDDNGINYMAYGKMKMKEKFLQMKMIIKKSQQILI